jgi:Tfp pilus assembly protein PilX
MNCSSRRPGRRSRERGSALILAIIIIGLLSVLGIGFLALTTTDYQIANTDAMLTKGLYAADSGIQWASSQLFKKYPAAYMSPSSTGATINSALLSSNLPRVSSGSSDTRVTLTRPFLIGQVQSVGSQVGVWFDCQWTFTAQATLTNPLDSSDVIQKTIQADGIAGPIQSGCN